MLDYIWLNQNKQNYNLGLQNTNEKCERGPVLNHSCFPKATRYS